MTASPGPSATDYVEAWHCERCVREQWGKSLIYGVPLCLKCIFLRAEQPGFAHYHQAKIYVLEREVQILTRTNRELRERLAIAEGHVS